MKLQFAKMHGAGNDFVMLDCTKVPFSLSEKQIRFLGDRHFGVGADQILIVEPAVHPENDFRYRIFNQDGGEVEMCGNGSRCFVQFVRELGLTDKTKIRVETMKGVIEPELQPDGRIKVNMGAPKFAHDVLPFNPEGLESRTEGRDTLWKLSADGRDFWISAVSMGNPHAVTVVENAEKAPVASAGPVLEHSAAFPARVNVGFLEPLNRGEANLRVWERGAGETLACGTGACAAAVAGIRRGLFDSAVEIHAHGGDLRIEWAGSETDPVYLIGPSAMPFTGVAEIPED